MIIMDKDIIAKIENLIPENLLCTFYEEYDILAFVITLADLHEFDKAYKLLELSLSESIDKMSDYTFSIMFKIVVDYVNSKKLSVTSI